MIGKCILKNKILINLACLHGKTLTGLQIIILPFCFFNLKIEGKKGMHVLDVPVVVRLAIYFKLGLSEFDTHLKEKY